MASSITRGTIDSYVAATNEFSLTSLENACAKYASGDVEGWDRRWAPNMAELANVSRMFDDIERRASRPAEPKIVSYPMGGEPPAGYVAMGPIEVSFDGARIDMRNMTPRERAYVMEHKRLPPRDGAKQIGVVPRLQRMAGQ